MESNEQTYADIAAIRNIMERSSRVLTLSGLSGVFAGAFALLGAAIVYFDLKVISSKAEIISYSQYIKSSENTYSLTSKLWFLGTLAIVVLVLSLLFGYYFSRKKAVKSGLKLWDKSSKLLLYNLFVPLVVGGIFCVILISHGALGLVAPATLIFYGLALLNASKYTFKEIHFLALTQIFLGILGCFFYGMGLLFWTIGFGVMHILYGVFMYIKYEKTKNSK